MQEYSNSDRHIHWLSQVLAKVNRAYVPEQEDDSHTNLYFDDIGKRILGRWIDGPKGKMILGLDMLGYLQAESEIRIWPHHFDTGIYTMVSDNLGLGFGLAMKDALLGEAYFYISGYGAESPLEYQNLPNLSAGRWESGEQWKGAVLPLSDLPDSSHEEAIQVIRSFIKEATDWFSS